MTKWIAHYGGYEEYTGIIDEAFRSFLDVCWPYVDYFTFSSCRDDSVSEERRYGDFCELKKELTPFLQGEMFDMSGSDMALLPVYWVKCVSTDIELQRKQKK